MKTLFTNIRLLSMANGPVFENKNVLVDGNKIAYVGEEIVGADKVIDGKGYILMPGLKNAHTHSAMVFLKGIGEGLPLDKWLEVVYPHEAKLTPQDVKKYTKECIKEYLEGGTTAIFDMYFFSPSIAEAANEEGIRLTNLYMMETHPERKEMIENEFAKWSIEDSLVKPYLGFHAEYTIEDAISYTKELQNKYKVPLFTHISETQNEVDGSIKRRGTTPTSWLDSLNMFEFGGGGYHCVYLSDHDKEIFKQKGLCVVTCMGSNLKLKDGLCPVDQYLKEGINVCIGTDGPTSNECLSMWREMSLVKKAFPSIDNYEILKMATVNSSKAMGWDKASTISVGQYADFILVDSIDLSSLVSKTNYEDVKLVYINGVERFRR